MATRYWVGGTGTWDSFDTTNWSTTSGGAGGASAPTSADSAIFNASSGGGDVYITDGYCSTVTFSGFTGNLWIYSLNASGSITLATTVTIVLVSQINMNATGSLNTAGKDLSGGLLYINSGTATLANTLTMTGGSINVIGGTLSCNAKAVTVDTIYVSSGTLTMSTGTINVNAFIGYAGSVINANTSTLVFNSTNTSPYIQIEDTHILKYVEYKPSVTGNMTLTLYSNLSCNTFTFAPSVSMVPASTTDTFAVNLYSSAYTITTSSTFTSTGQSTGVRNLIYSQGTPATDNLKTAARVITYTDLQNISSNATVNLTTAVCGDLGGNTRLTFASPTTRYAKAAGNWSATATWASTSGGTAGASIPLPQDTIVFDANSGAGTYTNDMLRVGNVQSTSGFSRTIDFGYTYIFGNLTLDQTGGAVTGTRINLYGTGASNTIKSVPTIPAAMTLSTASGTVTYTLGGNLITTSTLTASTNFNTGNYNVTCTRFTGGNSATLTLGNSTITCSGTANAWAVGNSTVITAGTSTIVLSDTSTSAKGFDGRGKTYNNVVLGNGGGVCVYTIYGSNTFNKLQSNKTSAYTVRLTANTTQTVSYWEVYGGSGRDVTLDTTTAGTRATLAKAGGGTTVMLYSNIKDIAGSPTNTWTAYYSTDSGNNLNINFAAAPTGTSNFFMVF